MAVAPSSSVCTSLCVVLAKGPSYFWRSWLVGYAKQSLGLFSTTVSQISHIILLFFFFLLSAFPHSGSDSPTPLHFSYISTNPLLDWVCCDACVRKKWQSFVIVLLFVLQKIKINTFRVRKDFFLFPQNTGFWRWNWKSLNTWWPPQ